jgi:hypothetical protein
MKRFIQVFTLGVFLLLLGMNVVTAQEVVFVGGPSIPIAASGGVSGANGGFAWGDINGDGIFDVFVPSNIVLYNNLTSFTPAASTATVNVPVNNNSTGLLLADFNGDGVLDLFTTNGGSPSGGLLYNIGGVFTAATGTGDLASAGVTGEVFQGASAAPIDHTNYLSLCWPGTFTNIASNNPAPPGGGMWLLKGGPTGFTNIGKGAIAGIPNVVQNFESDSLGTSYAHLGWSPSDVTAIDTLDPLGGTNKCMKVKVNNYNGAPVLAFTLPAGKKLSDYKTFTFNSYWAQGDVGYKDIIVEASQTLPTGHALDGSSTTTLGKWNRAAMGSTAWEPISIDITNTSNFTGTIYIDFGINCSGTGNVGGTGVQTQWYADNVTLVSSTGGAGGNLAIDTTLSYESWDVRFFDANNDGYMDLLMPSFRNQISKIDTGSSGARKGCVLFLNDGTGKFYIPNATTLGRPIYSIGAGNIASTVGDTGIIVDDTVRHFAAIGEQWGDLNNDGIEDLVLNGLNATDNLDGNGAYQADIILYGKGDGTFTYKWDGVHVVANNGIVQNTGQRAISIGDYNNDGLADIYTCLNGGAQHLYRNNGDGTFTDEATADLLTANGGRAGQLVDYNNDGFLDIFIYTGGAANLQKNNGNTNKWIGITPIGTGHNMSAIGARFTVWIGGKKQIRDIRAEGGSAGMGGTLRANFGIGTATAIDSVVTRWPDGVRQTWPGAAFTISSYNTVIEGSAYLAAPATSRPSWAAGDTSLPSSNTFKWAKMSGGTVGVKYAVQIGTSKAMTSIFQSFTALTDTFKLTKVPLASKMYWRVATLSGNFQGPWSAVDSFQTNKTPATTVPKKLSPTSNQLRLPKQPTLICSSTPEAYIYHFQVSDTISFSRFFFNDSTTVIDTFKVMNAMTPGKQYYWRVRGWNAAGASAFSPVDSFTIMYLPATPTLAYPGPNQADARGDTLVFKVRRVDGDSNYVYQYWTFTNAGRTFFSDTTKHDSSHVVTGLLNRQRYYWQVQAFNQAGASAFTPVDSFTTVIELPSVPLTLTPKNSTAEPRKTKFVWRKSTNAVWYHLQVATTNFISPSDIVEEVTVQTDTTYTIKDTLLAATLYYWHVSAVNLGGETSFSTSAKFISGYGVTGVSQQIAEIPKDYSLLQNYPNPFNPTTTISYDLPKTSVVKLYIYDVLGRVVANLADGIQSPNRYVIEWNPSHLSSGVYFCRIQAHSQDGSADFTSVKKLLYMK